MSYEIPKTGFASCCVLSYERPEFLRTAVSTLVGRADYPIEVIVHDDGSEDPMVKDVLLALQAQGLIGTLILNPPGHNEGVGVAVNRCFDVARGDYLLKLDQDLVFSEGWLRKCVDIYEKNRAEAGALNGFLPQIGALGLFRYDAWPVKYEDMFIKQHRGDEFAWEEHQDFVGSAMMFERRLWERFRPFPERSAAFAEDLEFKEKIKENGYKMALPTQDLATNQGFGVGPSTVVVQKDDGELTARGIKDGPRVLAPGGLPL